MNPIPIALGFRQQQSGSFWRFVALLWIAIFLALSVAAAGEPSDSSDACTIGVAAEKATVDGRPLVWKTRDLASSPDNEVYFNTSDRYAFLSVVNAGYTYAWMGVNEKGFAIVNSFAGDLPRGHSGPTNGLLMRTVLGECATVADFQHFLDSTNVTGRQTQANFAVIDATGTAALFETADSFYRKFNAADAPNGALVRTNFSLTGGGQEGKERYNRSRKLISDFVAGDSLSYRTILRHEMRDFSDSHSRPVPVPFPRRWRPDRPFGYIYTGYSICRSPSVSAVVVHGVKPGEAPALSTFWTILGQPASSIAVPYWPVGRTPHEANGMPTAPLCDEARRIKARLFDYAPNSSYIDSYKLRDENGNGLWACIFPAEDSIFAAAETHLTRWRRTGTPPRSEMEALEKQLAGYAFRKLQQADFGLSTAIPQTTRQPAPFVLLPNYPNPFNPATTLSFTLPQMAQVTLQIYDVHGRCVQVLFSGNLPAGHYKRIWRPGARPSGVYFCQLQAVPRTRPRLFVFREKMVYVK